MSLKISQDLSRLRQLTIGVVSVSMVAACALATTEPASRPPTDRLPGSEFPVGRDSCCYDWPTSSPRGRVIASARAREATWREAHPTPANLKDRREREERLRLDSLGRARMEPGTWIVDHIVANLRVSNECDGNGIHDSLDILVGAAEDVDGNWLIDRCDTNLATRNEALGARWRAAQLVPDSVYVRTRHLGLDLVEISYTVADSGARVVARAVDPDGRRVARLLDVKRARGAYSILWNKLDDRGRRVPPGRYWVELRVDDRRFRRPVQWR